MIRHRQENPEAAGWCARLCEKLEGAEAFVASDGLDAFISVAMGQSVGGGGGLMMALAESLTKEMSNFKISIFETLLQAGKWPQFKGKVAGSGILGVISAQLLSPKASPESRALMARLCGALAADAQDVAQLGDALRAEDAKSLRHHLKLIKLN